MTYGLLYVPVPGPEAPQTTETKPVPLTRRDVSIVVRPTGANVTEKLLFMNTQNNDVETEFRYPMKRGRVNGLRFRVEDDDWMTMNVEEKLEATKKYHEAVSSGNQAVLGSQLSDDVFSIKVGRLRPHEMVWIEVNLFSELDWADCYAYRHQLTMVPPYLMQDEDMTQYQSKAPKFSSGDDLPYGIYLNIRCEDVNPFTVDVVADDIQQDLKSNEGNIVELKRVKLTGKKDIRIEMHPTVMKPSVNMTQGDEHFYYQVSFGHNANDLGSAKLVATEVTDEHLKDVLSDYELVETETEGKTTSSSRVSVHVKPEEKRYVFVVDGSGSMSGSAIDNARTALKIAIKQLPQESKYMILVFGSDSNWGLKNQFYPPQLQNVKPLRINPCHPNVSCDGCNQYPLAGQRNHKKDSDIDLCDPCFKGVPGDKSDYDQIQPVTELKDAPPNYDDKWETHNDTSFKKCMEWVDMNVNANYGGTEMAVAVNSVYERLNAARSNVIIMLTDAGIGDGQANSIVSQVKNSSIRTEVFGLGIGNGCSMSFLEKMSDAARGVSFHVVKNDEIKDRTLRLMACATESQFLRNLSFDVPSHMSLSTKKPVSCYFRGEPLNVFVKVAKSDFTGDETFVLKSGETPIMSLDFKSITDSPVNLETIYHMTYLEQLLKFPDLYRQGYGEEDVVGKMTKDEYRKTVIELGCKYNVVTQFTSAVIVRELTDSDGSTKMEKVDIPIAVGREESNQSNEIDYSRYVLKSALPSRGFAAAAFGAPMRGMAKSKSAPRSAFGGLESYSMGVNTVGQTLRNSSHDISDATLASMAPSPWRSEECERSASASMGFSDCRFESAVDTSEDEEDDMCYGAFDDDMSYSGPSVSANTELVEKSESVPAPSVSKYDSMSVEQLIDHLVLEQSSTGMWNYDEALLKHICNKSVEDYRALAKLTDDNLLMTLLVLAYMQDHTEFFSTYSKSFRNGESAMTGHLTDFRKTLLEVVQVGFN